MFSNRGYAALRTGSAVVRRADRGVVQVTGGDRIVWLQGLLTCDVPAITVGSRGYGAYLTPQGRMITDVWVAVRDGDVLLDVPATRAASLRDTFDRLIFAEDVQVADVSGSIAVIETFGPASTQYPRADEADALIAPRIAAGAVEVDLGTYEVYRIEQGIPRFLVDMDERTIPLEAGIEDRAISFTKGCYVGQEVIVRVTHRGGGRVAKKLAGLVFDIVLPMPAAFETPCALAEAPAGIPVTAGAREIGHVTSHTISPALRRPIALAYLHRDFLEPGTAVTVGDDRSPATVAALPFVEPT
jgi:folate-binding protein YgfZ